MIAAIRYDDNDDKWDMIYFRSNWYRRRNSIFIIFHSYFNINHPILAFRKTCVSTHRYFLLNFLLSIRLSLCLTLLNLSFVIPSDTLFILYSDHDDDDDDDD